MGEQILTTARCLSDRYRFILLTYRNQWAPTTDQTTSRGQALRAYEKYGLLMHRPPDLLPKNCSRCYESPIGAIGPGDSRCRRPSVSARLAAISPRLRPGDYLANAIARTLKVYPMDKLNQLANEILSHPGEAAPRMRAEIYRLLELAPPPAREMN